MKARLITVLVTLTSLAAALTPIAEAAGRWG
jgi:prolipoprotein diacylglyceryltransferase